LKSSGEFQKRQRSKKPRRIDLQFVDSNKKPAGIPTGFCFERDSLVGISG
jgi:hypothetical protein